MMAVPGELPTGIVTFLFTDVEGSTKLLHELGTDAYAHALTQHRRVLRDAFASHGGVEVDTQGDAFFVVFRNAQDAVAAARDAQEALASGPIRVRMGLHTGAAKQAEEGYVGADVHLGARISGVGHGGQVLLSQTTRELVGGEISDLGEHRLKDFVEPVWIFQLDAEQFPPLRTISNTNLPRPASSFVGRGREVDELASLLRDGARLLTLTGAGGSGKTRLALETAAELVPKFKGGVFWIGLATLHDPALVLDTIAHTLGAKDGLGEHIGERELLLLLDNFEQVIDAAPDLAALVEACPNLRMLVTSREVLRVRGEVEYPVLPLDEPEAVELFCTRARLDPEEAIDQLCARLDNLPLAVELAAARTSVLSPRQILERVTERLDLLKGGRDIDPRQLTLRATIAWSHDLLDEHERQLFALLAVFRGGCTLEAAERVADATLDVVQSLVDKSLLRHTGERFWMLETIREFAAEQLDQSGTAEKVRHRHALHYLALADEAYPNLRGDPTQWLDRLEAEHDNLRAALDWLEASGETQLALQLAGALYRFWYFRGHFAEGRRRLERLLAADGQPAAARARALNGASVMAINTGDPVTAKARSEEALELHRKLGDEWGVAYSTFSLALAATEEAEWAVALPMFEESLARFRKLGDNHYTLIAGDGVAWVAGQLGDLERCRRGHAEVLRDARSLGDWAIAASQLEQLAQFASDEGRIDDALSMLAEALRMKGGLGIPHLTVESLCRFAATLVMGRRPEIAARLLAANQALREQIGGGFAWVAEVNETTLANLRSQLDEPTLTKNLEQGRKLTADEAVELALASAEPGDGPA
jgi:predicted ATPase/class 3 adenylate cyclase